jgi:hypothetical protein
MLPPLPDFLALAGIALVASAGCLCLSGVTSASDDLANAKGRWLAGICLVVMWIPVGAPQLPVAAYIRGLTSDFSVSMVFLAALGIFSRLFGLSLFDKREWQAVFYSVAAAALFLYPLALGWGDWDAYRLGWGSAAMWAGLLLLSVTCWVAGWRLLPLLIAAAMLSWAAQLMESTNLWDYLFDPWLAVAAVFKSLSASATQLRHRFLRKRAGALSAQRPLNRVDPKDC